MSTIIKCFIYMLLISSLLSCDKDRFEHDFSGGKATAQMNGRSWTAQGRALVSSDNIGHSISFSRYDDFGQLRQNLRFAHVPDVSGEYVLFEFNPLVRDSLIFCTFNTLSDDGDVLEDIYNVIEPIGHENTITVHSYDAGSRRMTGSFSVMLEKQEGRGPTNNPDTILFEMGAFEVIVEE